MPNKKMLTKVRGNMFKFRKSIDKRSIRKIKFKENGIGNRT